MARKIFLICAGTMMLAIAYHLGAAPVGARSTSAASVAEVVVLQGALNPGEAIPLPIYADGVQALESDCHWIVSLANDLGGPAWCYAADAFYAGTPGSPTGAPQKDFLEAHRGRVINSGQNDVISSRPTVNFLIIAVRSGAVVGTEGATWGSVKARYR